MRMRHIAGRCVNATSSLRTKRNQRQVPRAAPYSRGASDVIVRCRLRFSRRFRGYRVTAHSVSLDDSPRMEKTFCDEKDGRIKVILKP